MYMYYLHVVKPCPRTRETKNLTNCAHPCAVNNIYRVLNNYGPKTIHFFNTHLMYLITCFEEDKQYVY